MVPFRLSSGDSERYPSSLSVTPQYACMSLSVARLAASGLGIDLFTYMHTDFTYRRLILKLPICIDLLAVL